MSLDDPVFVVLGHDVGDVSIPFEQEPHVLLEALDPDPGVDPRALERLAK